MNTTFDDGRSKEDKRETKKEDSHPLFTETQIPITRSNVLRGICLFCENRASRVEQNKNDPPIIGQPFTCETKTCIEKWDELSMNQLKILISWRAQLG